MWLWSSWTSSTGWTWTSWTWTPSGYLIKCRYPCWLVVIGTDSEVTSWHWRCCGLRGGCCGCGHVEVHKGVAGWHLHRYITETPSSMISKLERNLSVVNVENLTVWIEIWFSCVEVFHVVWVLFWEWCDIFSIITCNSDSYKSSYKIWVVGTEGTTI